MEDSDAVAARLLVVSTDEELAVKDLTHLGAGTKRRAVGRAAVPLLSEIGNTRSQLRRAERRQLRRCPAMIETSRPGRSFYTVPEAADILRCGTSTLYRAIREDCFPAVRIRARYVIPVRAITELIDQAMASERCVDVAQLAADRRTERELAASGITQSRARDSPV